MAEERKRADLTQEQLAYRAHLHPVYISQVERGVKYRRYAAS
jgi:transcriptional regulator with XRE-family HTH domain